jgi:transcriptional regulator GlxA family with amidase domain
MRIGVLVTDGCFGSGVAALVDILAAAEALRAEVDASIPAIETVVAGARARVSTSSGMSIPTQRRLRELDDLDVVVVPALGTMSAPATEAALDGAAGRSLVRAIRSVDPAMTRVAAACTGVFALAQAGLADGRRATTTWFLAPTFRRRFPAVALDLDNMVVIDGPVITAGAAFAHIDLALTLVRGISGDLAQRVARLLVIDERPSQAAYVAYDQMAHNDPLVLAFERHVRAHLAEPFDVAAAAAALGVTRRTLERKSQQALGVSPLALVQRLRVQRAEHLRRTGDLSVEQIARQVGYANAATLRALRQRHASHRDQSEDQNR